MPTQDPQAEGLLQRSLGQRPTGAPTERARLCLVHQAVPRLRRGRVAPSRHEFITILNPWADSVLVLSATAQTDRSD